MFCSKLVYFERNLRQNLHIILIYVLNNCVPRVLLNSEQARRYERNDIIKSIALDATTVFASLAEEPHHGEQRQIKSRTAANSAR